MTFQGGLHGRDVTRHGSGPERLLEGIQAGQFGLPVVLNRSAQLPLLGTLDDRVDTAGVCELVAAFDVGAVWDALLLDRRRPVLQALVVVTVLPRSRRGRLPGGAYFGPEALRFDRATETRDKACRTRSRALSVTPWTGFVQQMEGA